MPVSPYLFFNGNCAEAMRFYEKTLGGKLETFMTYAENPDGQLPKGVAPDKIMHASLKLNDGSVIMASDDMSGAPYKGMSGVAIATGYSTLAKTKAVFDALGAGGKVVMPFGKTFWSEGFGMVEDRFGTQWMLGVEDAQK